MKPYVLNKKTVLQMDRGISNFYLDNKSAFNKFGEHLIISRNRLAVVNPRSNQAGVLHRRRLQNIEW